MNETLSDYDQHVKLHLRAIINGAEMVKSHVAQLVYRPPFETLAYEDMENVEHQLLRALGKIQLAKRLYRDKPVDD